ncbi:hypothetical protein C8R45DRAFT_1212311 [Mycena sanguinolenta]|nr:hypothetical protein C8R45DRAFT_1212311 [Mycena sanguinolenta]
MSREPQRFNDDSEAEHYFAPDPRTWMGVASYTQQAVPHQPRAPGPFQFANVFQTPNQHGHTTQAAANQQLQFQMMQAMGQMPPSHFPPPHAVRVPTQIDSRPPDYWHSNKHLMSVNYASPEQYPHTVSYRPTSGPCTFGVALLNLEYGLGMVGPTQGLDELLPPSIRKYAHGSFLLEWPGYRAESFVLMLVEPKTQRYVTRAAFGAQVTQIFKDFINSRKDSDFLDRDGAMRLGTDGVWYDQVRLAELYTKDGLSFRAQWALNAHLLSVT